jgi:hypothetical protein
VAVVEAVEPLELLDKVPLSMETEEMAVVDAVGRGNLDLSGATAFVSGVGHICDTCQEMMDRLGIEGVLTSRWQQAQPRVTPDPAVPSPARTSSMW